jgi:hypothetical protein
MRIEAVEIQSESRKNPKRILIDSGSGPLEARISSVLPGMRVIGVFFYPGMGEICIHVVKEEL